MGTLTAAGAGAAGEEPAAMLKVLQIHSPYRIPGGEDTVVANEARLLREAGHEVWRFFEPNPDSTIAAIAATAAAPWNPMSARELRGRLRVERPDVAHVHNTWFRLSPSVLSVLASEGIPVVRTLHNYRMFCIEGQTYRDGHSCTDCLSSPWAGLRHGCYRSRPLSVVATATQITGRSHRATGAIHTWVAPSSFMADLVIAGGVPADRTIVKPHFTFDPGERPAAPHHSDTVAVVGRLAEGKGVDLLLEAWRRDPPPGLRLEVIGSGPLLADLQRAAPRGVTFRTLDLHGVQQRLLEARALVFPSLLNETFGLVVVEAMAAGLPVVGFDAAGTAEVLGEQTRPVLAPPGDVADLGRLLHLLTDDEFVDATGGLNRARYLRRYSPSAQLPLLMSLYDAAVRGRPPRMNAEPR